MVAVFCAFHRYICSMAKFFNHLTSELSSIIILAGKFYYSSVSELLSLEPWTMVLKIFSKSSVRVPMEKISLMVSAGAGINYK